MFRETMKEILAEQQAKDREEAARINSLYPVPEPVTAGLDTGFKEAAKIPDPEQKKAKEPAIDSEYVPSLCSVGGNSYNYGGGCNGGDRYDHAPARDPGNPCP